MPEHYEFFKKEFEFHGKHARMAEELWKKDQIEKGYFKRLIDLYLLAPIIGFRMNRKAERDTSTSDTRSIFAEQIIKEKDTLDFFMQMILLLEDTDKKSAKECIDLAFRSAETKEDFEQKNQLFHDYVRGGVEELYERLILRKPELEDNYQDDKAGNIMALYQKFCIIKD